MSTSEHPLSTNLPDTCATHPLGRAIRLIGDVWILLIVVNLLSGAMRYSELLAAMDHVSSKTLSQRLRYLEEIQFVERHAYPEIPPRVEYALTDKGRALAQVIAAIEQFANEHLTDAAFRPCP